MPDGDAMLYSCTTAGQHNQKSHPQQEGWDSIIFDPMWKCICLTTFIEPRWFKEPTKTIPAVSEHVEKCVCVCGGSWALWVFWGFSQKQTSEVFYGDSDKSEDTVGCVSTRSIQCHRQTCVLVMDSVTYKKKNNSPGGSICKNEITTTEKCL